MRLSEKFSVPGDIALLYDFVNSLDMRQYVEKGAAHEMHDELATVKHLTEWMHAHSLGEARKLPTMAEHKHVLALRAALRAFVEAAPHQPEIGVAKSLAAIAAHFPLVVGMPDEVSPALQPSPGTNPLGLVLSQFYGLALTGRLNRLKMCASADCKWVFFDKSKPGNRRWCSATLCGNRHKIRRYRQRIHNES